jgi:transposase
MTGKSPVTAADQQIVALKVLAGGADRAEADRARAILLTLCGWTSARIAEAFSVREDTVRLWRSEFMRGGIDALRASVAPGPMPLKAEAALRVAEPLLSAPVADRRNWTLVRLAEEIANREGVTISRSQLSKVLRKKGGSASADRGTR